MALPKINIFGKNCHRAAFFCLLGLWPFLSFSSALMQISFWAAFALSLLGILTAEERFSLPDRFTMISIGLFLLTVLISMTVSEHAKQSIRGLTKVIRQCAVFFLAYHYFSNDQARAWFRRIFLFSIILISLDGFFQYFTGTDFIRRFAAQAASSGLRISASFENYGKFAAYLCVIAPISIGFFLQTLRDISNLKERLIWGALSLSSLILLFLTRSRGAFVAVFASFFVLLLLRRSWKTIGALVVCGLLFVAVLPKSMLIHLDKNNQEQSILERFDLWQRAIDVIKAKPWTGTGINTYAVAHQAFDIQQSWRVKNYYAHNGYLQMAAEIGLPGLLFFILFLLNWFWRHKPVNDDTGTTVEIRWGILGGTMAFIIFCLGDTALHSPQPVTVFMYAMGLLGAYSQTRSAAR